MNKTSALFPPNDVDDEVRARIDSAVSAVVIKMGGKDAFQVRPAFQGATFTHEVPKARYAMLAARKLRDEANGKFRRAIDNARGEGMSWLEIGDELGLVDEGGVGADVQAFDLVASGDRFNRYTSWQCTSCNGVVTDRGPHNDYPTDNENGHADDCARLAAEINAWRKRHGEED